MDNEDGPQTAPDAVGELLRATGALVARVFDAPRVFVATQDEGTRAHLTWVHGPDRPRPPRVVDLGPELAAAAAGPGPLVLADVPGQPRPADQGPWLLSGTASVRVPRERHHWWMRLVVADLSGRDVGPEELDLLAGAATVMGSALDSDRRRRSQSHVADLVRCALESSDLDVTMKRALDVVAEVLDVPIATVFRRQERPGEFLVMADLQEQVLSPGDVFVLPPEFDAEHGARESMVVQDWATESRLSRPAGARDVGVEAFATANLRVNGRSWGRLAVGSPTPRLFSGSEVALLQGIADILAAAIYRSEIEARLRDTAEAFQRALLPERLPELAGVETAARYVPASGTLVGGDWYDVLDLPDGAVALVIGDVEGHDSTAATIMGQVRGLVRTYAGEGHGPAKIMSGVNRFVATHHERLVTCCYLELRPADLTLTGVRAGHPPPVAIAPDGRTRVLDLADGLSLGVEESGDYRERTILLSPGTTLLLATDGLIADEQEAAAVAAGIAGSHDAVETLTETLVRGRGPLPHSDDVAILVARLPALAARPSGGVRHARRVFGPFTESPRAARQFVSDVLTGWGLSDLADAAQLAASELVTNALVHTTSAATLVLRSDRPDRVWLGVGDESDRVVRLAEADDEDVSGRGLAIVSLLAEDWGVETIPGRGKTVWCTLSAAS